MATGISKGLSTAWECVEINFYILYCALFPKLSIMFQVGR